MPTLLLLVAAALTVAVLLGIAFFLRRALLTAEDVLSVPGREFQLRVEVERPMLPFLDPPVRGAALRARTGSTELGEQRTDRNGIAQWPHRMEALGSHPVCVSPGPGFPLRASPVDAHVLIADPARPLFVCDIDGTISDATEFGQALAPIEHIPPVEGAPSSLIRLIRRFQVVYLSARDHIFLAKTRAWLRHHGFPHGPVFLRRVRSWKAPARVHKEARLREILAPFTGPRIGVGDRIGDVTAYMNCNVKPIFLNRGGLPRELPRFALQADTWANVEALALAHLDQQPNA